MEGGIFFDHFVNSSCKMMFVDCSLETSVVIWVLGMT
jgi:hypothetical protein